jgi:hypothetical protein
MRVAITGFSVGMDVCETRKLLRTGIPLINRHPLDNCRVEIGWWGQNTPHTASVQSYVKRRVAFPINDTIQST